MHRVRVAIGLLLAAIVALIATVLYTVIATYMAWVAVLRPLALMHAAGDGVGSGGVGSVSAGFNEQIAYAVFLSGWAAASYCVLHWVASTLGAEARRWWRLHLWLAALTIAVAVSVEVAAWWSVLRSFHGALVHGCRSASIGKLLEPLACRLIARMRKLADRRAGNGVHYRMRTAPGLGMRARVPAGVGSCASALLFVLLQR